MTHELIYRAYRSARGRHGWPRHALTGWLARYGLVLRLSVGIVLLYFGALNLVPALGPANGLNAGQLLFLPLDLFIPFLGLGEIAIGLGFLTSRFMRLTILLMFLQVPGTARAGRRKFLAARRAVPD